MIGLEDRLKTVDGVASIRVELGDGGVDAIKVEVVPGADEAGVLEEIRQVLVAYGLRSRRPGWKLGSRRASPAVVASVADGERADGASESEMFTLQDAGLPSIGDLDASDEANGDEANGDEANGHEDGVVGAESELVADSDVVGAHSDLAGDAGGEPGVRQAHRIDDPGSADHLTEEFYAAPPIGMEADVRSQDVVEDELVAEEPVDMPRAPSSERSPIQPEYLEDRSGVFANVDLGIDEDAPPKIRIRQGGDGLIISLADNRRRAEATSDISPIGAAEAMAKVVSDFHGIRRPDRVGVVMHELDGERVVTLLVRRGDESVVVADVARPMLHDALYRAMLAAFDHLEGGSEPIGS